MRRLTKIVAVAAVASMAFAGCSKNDDSSSNASDNNSSSAAAGDSADVCKDATGDGPKVGLAYDVGGRGDQSFNDSAYAGLAKAVTWVPPAPRARPPTVSPSRLVRTASARWPTRA